MDHKVSDREGGPQGISPLEGPAGGTSWAWVLHSEATFKGDMDRLERVEPGDDVDQGLEDTSDS